MATVGLVFEYALVGLIVLACALYWGRRLFPRTARRIQSGLRRRTGRAEPPAPVARPSACGGCRGCDGGGCH